MKKQTTIWIAGIILIAGVFIFTGCDSGDDGYDAARVETVVDDMAEEVAEDLAEAAFATRKLAVPEPIEVAEEDIVGFNDILVDGSIVYAVFDSGLVAYDLIAESFRTVTSGEKLNTVVRHNDDIFVGGKKLYRVVDYSLIEESPDDGTLKSLRPALESVALYFEDNITDLVSFDGKLMIGTGNGLYAKNNGSFETVRAEIQVTAMAPDESGLWIGTDGQGLFRWENERLKKRFLLRDTTIFDHVNCLDYNRGYVYVGTDEAFFIFDGGQWETLTTDDGLPSNKIVALDADGWVIYVGTDHGVSGYFNGDFYPIKKFEDVRSKALGRVDNRIVTITANALLMKPNRHEMVALIESDEIIPEAIDYVDEGNDTIPGIVEENMEETGAEMFVEEEPLVDDEAAVEGTKVAEEPMVEDETAAEETAVEEVPEVTVIDAAESEAMVDPAELPPDDTIEPEPPTVEDEDLSPVIIEDQPD